MNVYKYYRMYTQNTKLYTNNLNPDVVTWTIFTLYYYDCEVEVDMTRQPAGHSAGRSPLASPHQPRPHTTDFILR